MAWMLVHIGAFPVKKVANNIEMFYNKNMKIASIKVTFEVFA